jgi:hypothetical protein
MTQKHLFYDIDSLQSAHSYENLKAHSPPALGSPKLSASLYLQSPFSIRSVAHTCVLLNGERKTLETLQ